MNKTTHNTPQEFTYIVTTHYSKEQQRAKPYYIPQTPWTQSENPDNFEVTPPTHDTTPHPVTTLDTYITRSHYDIETTMAPEGKASGLDVITIKLMKHLPEALHALLYTIFRIMAKYNYTPKE